MNKLKNLALTEQERRNQIIAQREAEVHLQGEKAKAKIIAALEE